MGVVDVTELEAKYQKVDEENQELEEKLRALEDEGAQLAAYLREVREQVEERGQLLGECEADGAQLRHELHVEQNDRAHLQEQLEVAEHDVAETDGYSRPAFVIFPTNRGTLVRDPRPSLQPFPVTAPLRIGPPPPVMAPPTRAVESSVPRSAVGLGQPGSVARTSAPGSVTRIEGPGYQVPPGANVTVEYFGAPEAVERVKQGLGASYTRQVPATYYPVTNAQPQYRVLS